MKLVIDFHLHMTNYDGLRPWVNDYYRQNLIEGDPGLDLARYSCPEEMDKLLEENGIDYGVMLAEVSPITTGISTTESVVEFCRRSRRVIPFATINPFIDSQPARLLERYVHKLGCQGLKLYPSYQYFYPNDRMLYPVYAKAEELSVPVVFHTGSSVFRGARLKYADPLMLDDIAVDFPGLKIVMAHSGRGFWYDRAFFLSRLHENVYMEISGLPPQNLLTYFPDLERNADKIIYGSDWPGMPYLRRNIELVRQLPISEATKDKILGLNAAKILGIGGDVESAA